MKKIRIEIKIDGIVESISEFDLTIEHLTKFAQNVKVFLLKQLAGE